MPKGKRKSDTDIETKVKRQRKKKGESNGDGFGEAASNVQDNAYEEEDEYEEIVLEGSKINGEVLLCGGTNWDLIGRKTLPKGVKSVGGRNLWAPHRVKSLMGVQVRTVISGCTGCHCLIITTEGKVLSWGRNDRGQLGHGDMNRKDIPTEIESLKDLNIVNGACGRGHTLLLSERGIVYGFGDNKFGQLGLSSQSQCVPSPTKLVYKGPQIRKVACGGDFSMVSDVRGNLYSFGCPEYGQLGHNSDGKYFVTSNKTGFSCETRPRKVMVFIEKGRDGRISPITDVEVVDVACGTNHTIIVDTKKRVFTWGFGGYGRLGHACPKDDLVPRMIKIFEGPNRGVAMIAAGPTFSMAVSELGVLYLWGQTKPTGEATMYPKPIQDLSGWMIRSIGTCNRSIVVAADDSLVSWGPSPTYGELGYGDNKPKSSTVPQEVKTIDGLYIYKVACGYGHTLMIAKNETEEEKQKIENLPVFEP